MRVSNVGPPPDNFWWCTLSEISSGCRFRVTASGVSLEEVSDEWLTILGVNLHPHPLAHCVQGGGGLVK